VQSCLLNKVPNNLHFLCTNLVCQTRLLQKREAQRLLLLSAFSQLLGLHFSLSSWASVIRFVVFSMHGEWLRFYFIFYFFVISILMKFDQAAAWSIFGWGAIS
jgi:hypothetical protein